MRNQKLSVALALVALIAAAGLLMASTTAYNEPWTSSLDGWAYTRASCSGTCADGLSTDGNPADSVSDKVTGRSKAESGFWSKSLTWQAVGVPAGDTVNTVDGQWDDKAVQTAVACTSSSTMGMQIFDSANATEITASAVEPLSNVAGDTSAWTNHNPTGAVQVNAGYQAASTSITLRFNLNPASGSNTSAACELRGDNYALTITSTTPSGRSRVVVISRHVTTGNLKIQTLRRLALLHFPVSSFRLQSFHDPDGPMSPSLNFSEGEDHGER